MTDMVLLVQVEQWLNMLGGFQSLKKLRLMTSSENGTYVSEFGPFPDDLKDVDYIDYDLAVVTMKMLHSRKQGTPFAELLVRCHWFGAESGDRRFWSKIDHQGEYRQWGNVRGDRPRCKCGCGDEAEEEHGGA